MLFHCLAKAIACEYELYLSVEHVSAGLLITRSPAVQDRGAGDGTKTVSMCYSKHALYCNFSVCIKICFGDS